MLSRDSFQFQLTFPQQDIVLVGHSAGAHLSTLSILSVLAVDIAPRAISKELSEAIHEQLVNANITPAQFLLLFSFDRIDDLSFFVLTIAQACCWTLWCL